MTRYKSLMVVMILGGVMLGMAGVLLTTDSAAKRKKPSKPTEGKEWSVRLGDKVLTIRAEGRPRQASSFRSDLETFRKILTQLGPKTPQARDRLKTAMEALVREVQPGDWPVIEAELNRPNPPTGLRGFLLALSGALRTDRALPYWEKYFKEHTTRVIEGWKRDGRPQVFKQAVSIYRKSKQSGTRFLILQALDAFPEPLVRQFLVEELARETQPETLRQVVTLLRFHGSPEVVDRLLEFARSLPADEAVLCCRVFNTLAGMSGMSGPKAVLATACSASEKPEVCHAAAQSLSFMKKPELVPEVLRGMKGPGVSHARLQFLIRNLQPAHAEALEEALQRIVDPEARRSLEKALERIRTTKRKP